jgi:hypothetical protein
MFNVGLDLVSTPVGSEIRNDWNSEYSEWLEFRMFNVVLANSCALSLHMICVARVAKPPTYLPPHVCMLVQHEMYGGC